MTRLFDPTFHGAPPAVDYVIEPLVERKKKRTTWGFDFVVAAVTLTVIIITGAIVWPH